MFGTIKCVGCNAITDIHADTREFKMLCSGCKCNLCTTSGYDGDLHIFKGERIGELTLAEIDSVSISGAKVMTVLRANHLRSLYLDAGDDCRNVVCVYAQSLDRVELWSPASFQQTNIRLVVACTSFRVPECERVVIKNCSITSDIFIPQSVACVSIINPHPDSNQAVIQQLIHNGNPRLTLMNIPEINSVRYPNTLTELKIVSCRNICRIIPPTEDNLRMLQVNSCNKLKSLPKFAQLHSLFCRDQFNNIRIPFMSTIRRITVEPCSDGLADMYHFSKCMGEIRLCSKSQDMVYPGKKLRRRLTRMHARVHVIERWWIDVASSPPSPGQPAGGRVLPPGDGCVHGRA